MIYAAVLLYLCALSLLYDTKVVKAGKTGNFVLAFAILFALAGFRYLVGGDTYNYHYRHDSMPSLLELGNLSGYSDKIQPVWIIFTAIAKAISAEFYVLQLMHAFIVNAAVFLFIRHTTPYRFTAIFIYSFAAYPVFNFEVMRESLAIALFLFAFPFYRRGQDTAYYLVATLAFLNHFSALILFALPLARHYMPPAVSTRNIVLLALPTILFCLSAALNPVFTLVLNSIGVTSRLLVTLQSYSDYNYSIFGLISLYVLYVLFPTTVLLISNLANNRNSELVRLVHLAIWVGAITPLYFIFFRFINYFAIPLIVVVTHSLIHMARSASTQSIRAPVLIAGLMLTAFFYTFRYFGDTSEYADNTRWYQRWYPYHSILNPVQDSERMRLLIGISRSNY